MARVESCSDHKRETGYFADVRMALFFTRGMSLEGWSRKGILDRELALYRALEPHLGEIAILTYGGQGDMAFREQLGDIVVLPNTWRLAPNLFSIVAPFLHNRALRRASVFKTNQINGAWCAVIAKVLFRRKLVVRCGYLWSVNFAREVRTPWKRALVRLLERVVFRSGDRIVVPAEGFGRHVIDQYGVDPRRISVIPNYVNTDVFRPVPDVAKTPGLLCFVGRLSAEKNLFALLEAIEGIPKARLAIVGDGPMRGALEDRAREGRLPVTFLGTLPNDEVPAVLNRAEIFVLPSLYEGHPKALLEAMACGLPVVATDVAGTKDVIRHGETGFLCGTTAHEIRQALVEVLENQELCRQMAARAREYVVRECSLERSVELELAVLATLGER